MAHLVHKGHDDRDHVENDDDHDEELKEHVERDVVHEQLHGVAWLGDHIALFVADQVLQLPFL